VAADALCPCQLPTQFKFVDIVAAHLEHGGVHQTSTKMARIQEQIFDHPWSCARQGFKTALSDVWCENSMVWDVARRRTLMCWPTKLPDHEQRYGPAALGQGRPRSPWIALIMSYLVLLREPNLLCYLIWTQDMHCIPSFFYDLFAFVYFCFKNEEILFLRVPLVFNAVCPSGNTSGRHISTYLGDNIFFSALDNALPHSCICYLRVFCLCFCFALF